MKPFDLEKAKNGAPVCFEDGTPVKILDFDYYGRILVRVMRIKGDEEQIDSL